MFKDLSDEIQFKNYKSPVLSDSEDFGEFEFLWEFIQKITYLNN